VVVRWRAFAGLAAVPEVDDRALTLLADVGIRSVADRQQERSAEQLRALFAELTVAATTAGMRPPDATEFADWLGHPLPPPEPPSPGPTPNDSAATGDGATGERETVTQAT
jgi:hypothetical protein